MQTSLSGCRYSSAGASLPDIVTVRCCKSAAALYGYGYGCSIVRLRSIVWLYWAARSLLCCSGSQQEADINLHLLQAYIAYLLKIMLPVLLMQWLMHLSNCRRIPMAVIAAQQELACRKVASICCCSFCINIASEHGCLDDLAALALFGQPTTRQ